MIPVFRFILLFLIVFACAAVPAHAQQTPGTGPNYETRLSTIEEQMRVLNGRIEQVEFAVRRVEQATQRMQGDVDARLTKLETETAAQQAAQQQQAAAAATAPPPAATTVPDINGSLGAVKLQDGKVVGGVNNPKAPPLPDTPPDYGLTAQEQYEKAFDTLRKADYPGAEVAFKAFIDKNPKEKLVENAKYWYGESLYVQNKYADAAAAFADAYQQNPQGAKAPDCLLKLGLSLGGLNKPAEACTTLAQLKSKYPNASATVRARGDEARSKLKCGAH